MKLIDGEVRVFGCCILRNLWMGMGFPDCWHIITFVPLSCVASRNDAIDRFTPRLWNCLECKIIIKWFHFQKSSHCPPPPYKVPSWMCCTLCIPLIWTWAIQQFLHVSMWMTSRFSLKNTIWRGNWLKCSLDNTTNILKLASFDDIWTLGHCLSPCEAIHIGIFGLCNFF